jgi:zeaxanthin epoxidase
MAIEDAFQLSVDIQEELKRDEMNPDLDKALKGYFRKRLVRAAAIHGMAGMAAFMASTYKAYLGEGLGPLEWMTKLKIPHPGRVSGQLVLKLTMPAVLDWVLTGYQSVLRMSGRAPLCRIEDKPLGFDESQFPTFMRDDDELLRAANADWYLTTQNDATRFHLPDEDSSLLLHLACTESSINTVADVNARHFTIQRKDGSYCISNLSQSTAVLRDGRTVSCHSPVPLRPGDEITINDVRVHVKFEHKSVALSGHGTYDRRNELVRHPELSPEPVAS